MKYLIVGILLGFLLAFGGCGTVGKDFNDSKISKIADGTTTRAEIRKMFGEPFKMGTQNGLLVWVYEYNLYHSIKDDKSKNLVVLFDSNGVVQSHQFMSSDSTP
jgi:outer membrane protein assembly factor BamE (lipoprotein component of BamABCDE complex)